MSIARETPPLLVRVVHQAIVDEINRQIAADTKDLEVLAIVAIMAMVIWAQEHPTAADEDLPFIKFPKMH
jgi:hypothetical protein